MNKYIKKTLYRFASWLAGKTRPETFAFTVMSDSVTVGLDLNKDLWEEFEPSANGKSYIKKEHSFEFTLHSGYPSKYDSEL